MTGWWTGKAFSRLRLFSLWWSQMNDSPSQNVVPWSGDHVASELIIPHSPNPTLTGSSAFPRRFWTSATFVKRASFTFRSTISRSTSWGPAAVGLLTPWDRWPWSCFYNIAIWYRDGEEFLLWSLGDYGILVLSDQVSFTSYERCNRFQEWALCQEFLYQPFFHCFGVEALPQLFVWPLANDLFKH